MAIETICAGCGQRLAVADEHAGKKARCPNCKRIYTVPVSSSAAKDAAALAETVAGNQSDFPASNRARDFLSRTEQFWMQTPDGNQFGPVDRPTINRWFTEGRVGQGYRIRQAENGPWQPAELFRPASTINPYADYSQDASSYPVTPVPSSTTRQYPNGDPSGWVFTMGILTWFIFLLCLPFSWIPGLVAWISGRRALKDIQNGTADPSNLTLVQVGYYLGMVNVILMLLLIVAFSAFMAIIFIADLQR